MQQSSMMGKHNVETPTRAGEPGRRKKWDVMVAGGSAGLGGFLVLGGVILATAFTARAIKRRKQPPNDAKEDVAGGMGTKDAGAAPTACCNVGSSGQGKEQADADGWERDTLVVEHPKEELPMLIDSASQPTLPQPPAPTEQHLMVILENKDEINRCDDGEEASKSEVSEASVAAKEEVSPEVEPILQPTENSSFVDMLECQNNNDSQIKTGVDIITEQNGAEVDREEIFRLEDETPLEGRPSQVPSEQNANANVVESDDHEGRSRIKLDRTSILQMEDETLSRDIDSQVSEKDDNDGTVNGHDEGAVTEIKGCEAPQLLGDEAAAERIPIPAADIHIDDAKVDNHHQGGGQEDTNQLLHASEIQILVTSKEEEEYIGTTNVDGLDVSVSQDDEALQENDEHAEPDVEDKDIEKTGELAQTQENSGTLITLEDQITLSDDLDNPDCLSNTVCLDGSEIGAVQPLDNVLSEETTELEIKPVNEADKVWIQHEETALQMKDPLPLESNDVDHSISTGCHDISAFIAQTITKFCCGSPGQGVDSHDVLIEDKPPQEERFTEEPAASVNRDNGPEAEDMRLPFHTSLEDHIHDSCANQDELDNIFQQSSKIEDKLWFPPLEDGPQQDMLTEETKYEIDDSEGNRAADGPCQVEHDSFSSDEDQDSTASSAESSWTADEINSSSIYDYEMKSQSDALINGKGGQKDVPSHQKSVCYGKQQEQWFSAKPEGRKYLTKWHFSTSYLQLAYLIVGLMLVFMIACSHNHSFDPCHIFYTLF